MNKIFEDLIRMYSQLFEIFLDKVPDNNLIRDYIIEHFITGYDDAYTNLMDFIGENLKSQLMITTNNSVLDCVEYMLYSIKENGNSVLGENFNYGVLKNSVYQYVYGNLDENN